MTNFWYGWTLLGLSTMGTCGGNLLLKQATVVSSNSSSSLVTSPWFVGAIACYIFDLLLFSQALKYVSVSAAVPVASGIRIAITIILASVFFSEHLSANQFLASGLIAIGILFMLHT